MANPINKNVKNWEVDAKKPVSPPNPKTAHANASKKKNSDQLSILLSVVLIELRLF